MKFKIPTANFQNDVRGDVHVIVFPRSERGWRNQWLKKNPIAILKIQLRF